MNLNTAKLSPMAKNQYGSMEFSFHKPSGNLKPSKKQKKIKNETILFHGDFNFCY